MLLTIARPSGWMILAMTAAVALPASALMISRPADAASAAEIAAIHQSINRVIPNIPESLVKAACDEGQVVLYQMALNPSAAEINAAFKKLVPCVQMNVIQAAGGQLAQRFEAGERSGDVPDFYEQSDPGLLEKAARAGLLLHYEPTVAKNLTTSSPGLWYPEHCIPIGFAYNTDRVTPDMAAKLKTWSSISDSTFDSLHVAVISPSSGGTTLIAFHDMMNASQGKDLKQFRPKNFQIFGTSQPAGESLASGESDLAFPFAGTTAIQMLQNGAPVRIAFPSPVDVVCISASIPKSAKNPSAGKLFLEYMLSRPAKETVATRNGAIPADPTMPFANKVTQESWWNIPKERYQYDFTDVTAKTNEIKDVFNKAFSK